MDLQFISSKSTVADTSALITSSESVSKGQPIYISTNNTGSLASSFPATSKVIGLASSDSFLGNSLKVTLEGCFEMFDWSAVTGTSLLSPGQMYYLASDPGKLSTNPPSVDGQVVVRVGTAISETSMVVRIGERIIL
jgi:hypothetical protein